MNVVSWLLANDIKTGRNVNPGGFLVAFIFVIFPDCKE